MPLPVALQLSQGVALQVVDYDVVDTQAVANAAGVATVTFDQVDPSQLWRIERIVVQSSSANQLEVTIYTGAGSPIPIQARDWTPLPTGFVGVSEYPVHLTVKGGAQLTIQGTGAAAGDTLTVSVQYAVVQRVVGGS